MKKETSGIQLTADGSPSKQFFVSMITKDIALEDCILDLLDNAIDGAQRAAGTTKSLKSYWVRIALDRNRFSIEDNCEGISVPTAQTYAFHFGRPDHTDSRVLKHGIGLYGIGMKRAIFKLGDNIAVRSKTQLDGFVVAFRVREWARKEGNDWDFPLTVVSERRSVGTRIEVSDLHEGVGDAVGSATFQHGLERVIQRDYVRFLERGLVVKVNGRAVTARALTLLCGPEIIPARKRSTVLVAAKKVSVDVIAGMMQLPPSNDAADERFPSEDWGWYVLCNDRVVLAADRSTRTGWGMSGVPAWHAQYNGFVGWTSISAADPQLLPWSTTKREMDMTNAVYHDALAQMREFTRQFVQYTNQRKRVPQATRAAEQNLKRLRLEDVRAHAAFKYPKAARMPKELQTIRYQVSIAEYDAAVEALGEDEMEPTELGRATFDYFMKAKG